jgi:hypothetical protein
MHQFRFEAEYWAVLMGSVGALRIVSIIGATKTVNRHVKRTHRQNQDR